MKFNQYLYGKHFTLFTDHQPLVAIFSPSKSVPVMAAARLQRWALLLGGHNYSVEFKGTRYHGNADGLSRLPQENSDDVKDDTDVYFTSCKRKLYLSQVLKLKGRLVEILY